MKIFAKRVHIILLVALLMISMVACGKSEIEGTPEQTPEQTLASEVKDVIDIAESIAQENSSVGIGEYVIPPESDFTWEEVDGGVRLTGYIGEDTTIQIPEKLGGNLVTAIGSGAFSNTEVVGVKIPDSVVTIEEKAFYYCTTLVEIILGSNVEALGDESFEGCVALTNVKLNAGLQTIGEMAFGMCTSLKEIALPNDLKELCNGVFGMSGLEKITIPGSVPMIGVQAFVRCLNLSEVIVEDGVKIIEDNAFQGCSALTKMELPASIEEIGWDAFVSCDDIVIYAPSGSVAETYAGEFGHTFKSK